MNEKPSAILYFSSFGSLRWGGQKSLYLLVRRLDRRHFSPIVALPEAGEFAEQLRRDGIPSVVIPLPPLRFIRAVDILETVLRIKTLIRHRGIRILHTDGPRNTLYAGLTAKLTRVPLVWHIRSSDRDRYDGMLSRLCDRMILVSDALRHRFQGKANSGKLIVIHNGIPLDQGTPDIEHTAGKIRSDLNIGGDTILIIQAARIDPMKGQHHLIEACAELGSRIPFKLLLMGEITDSDYHRRCRGIIDQAGLTDSVIFTGHIEDMTPHYLSADIVVLASPSSEAFSRSILEAMAAAKPVIATDIGGNREAVIDGVTGFIVPPADKTALSGRIMQLAMDETLRARMGEAAKARVHRMFCIENNVRETETVYRDLLDRSLRGPRHE